MVEAEDFHIPVSKRQKIEINAPDVRPTGSRLFAPFRTVGLVSPTSVPFTSVPLGTTTFQVTTSVGRSLQTYDLRSGLNLVFLSRPQCPDDITATYAYRDRVFAAWGGQRPGTARGIWIFKRGKVVGELELVGTRNQDIRNLLVFGTWIVGVGSEAIEVWESETHEHYTTIPASSQTADGENHEFTGCLCTLPTFLNKLFVGTRHGNVDVYNLRTGKLVHSVQPPFSSGYVTALAPTPAAGLLAIAYAHGSLVIVDIDNGETILQFQRVPGAHAISSISFRTDGAGAGEDGRQEGIMATSSSQTGDITFWDLNRGGKVAGVLRSAHEVSSSSQASGINKIEYLSGQPIIISSGLDNSLRSWIFDQSIFSPVPRLLHIRSGHAAPVSNLQFLPAASNGSETNGKWLLSAGRDRSFWGFSLRKDGQSCELSQGDIQRKAKMIGAFSDKTSKVEDLKAPVITAIACSLNRDGGMGAVKGPVWTNPKTGNAEDANMTGWESIVTAHEGDRYARTWFWGRKKAGRWAFETGDLQAVTSVAITTCGTFALIGSAAGSLDAYNLQSGAHRQRFPSRLKPGQAKQLQIQQAQFGDPVRLPTGHTDGITGIVVDNLNQTMISTSLDGVIIFWDFATGRVLHKTTSEFGSPTALRYNSVSHLVSMACDDSCIRVVDVDTKRTVRELWGCVGQIYDHCFSHDGKWIVACSMDSVVRVFDLATGHLIDAFKTATCTNVAFSSTGEFLATAHAGNIGINIWNNKSLFMHISSHQIDGEHGIIDLTSTAEFEAANQLAIQDIDNDINGNVTNMGTLGSTEQLDEALLTLSLNPPSKWQTLLNLDTIRERNKPIQPPEKPKAAPFFLGSSLSDETTRNAAKAFQEVSKTTLDDEKSRVSRLASFEPTTKAVSSLLLQFVNSPEPNPEPLVRHLSNLGPSATDLEIRSLTLDEMVPFIEALTARLRQRCDFELVNTWMSVFLKLHAEFVSQVNEIRTAVQAFRLHMNAEEERLSALVGWNRGVIEFLRSAR